MSVFEQPVAHPPHVDDERPSAAAGELAAQAGRVRVQGPRLADRAEAPHVAQQLFLREDAARLRRKLERQLVLLRRQVDALAADRDATGRPVDLERADVDEVRNDRRRPPQDGSDARQQLVIQERPAEEVVGSALERPSAVDGIGLGSADHDERHLARPRAAFLERRGIAEQDEIRARPLRERKRLVALRCAEDVEAVVREMALEKAAGRGLRLGDEDRIRHTRDATGAPPPQLDVLCCESETNREQLPRPARPGPGGPRRLWRKRDVEAHNGSRCPPSGRDDEHARSWQSSSLRRRPGPRRARPRRPPGSGPLRFRILAARSPPRSSAARSPSSAASTAAASTAPEWTPTRPPATPGGASRICLPRSTTRWRPRPVGASTWSEGTAARALLDAAHGPSRRAVGGALCRLSPPHGPQEARRSC